MQSTELEEEEGEGTNDSFGSLQDAKRQIGLSPEKRKTNKVAK